MHMKTVGLFVLIVYAWLTSPSFAMPPPGLPDGWSDGYVYANGIRVHFYHAMPAPGKPIMVMVHGATDIALTWAMLAQVLQKSYDIYMPDTRGHGLSDPFTDADNGETLIKDTVEFVRAMNFYKPILVGHSMAQPRSCGWEPIIPICPRRWSCLIRCSFACLAGRPVLRLMLLRLRPQVF